MLLLPQPVALSLEEKRKKLTTMWTEEFALSEASYILLRLAQEFETIVAADDEPWSEDFGLTLSNALGCKVKLYRAIQAV